MGVSRSVERLCRTVGRGAALAGLLALAGCGGVLDPHGPIANGERKILFDAVAVMLALIIPTMLGGAWVAWHFRASNTKARHLPQFAFSGRIEILIWSVPTLIIVFLGGLIWFGAHQLDPYRPIDSTQRALDVQVVSLDWKWLFLYPDRGVASVNELVIPAGQPIHLDITSASVMNTFWAPQLAGMIYAMNGMVTQLNLAADHAGEFDGRSGHFSGDHFSDMRFRVRAVPPDEYDQWIARAQTAGPTLDRAAYEKLAVQGVVDRPMTYRDVDPALFHGIATQLIPPASGPDEGGPAGTDVHPVRGGNPTTAEK